MDDTQLDHLLDSSARSIPTGATRASGDLARGFERTQAPRVRGWHRGTIAATVAVVALLISGAGTIAAYQLDFPPFQTLEPGLSRVPTAVPVSWARDDGVTVRCLAFMELRDASPSQIGALNDYIRSENWNGYGESLAGEAARAPDATAPGPITDDLSSDLYQRAERIVAGLTFQSPGDGLSYTGEAVSCTYSK